MTLGLSRIAKANSSKIIKPKYMFAFSVVFIIPIASSMKEGQ